MHLYEYPDKVIASFLPAAKKKFTRKVRIHCFISITTSSCGVEATFYFTTRTLYNDCTCDTIFEYVWSIGNRMHTSWRLEKRGMVMGYTHRIYRKWMMGCKTKCYIRCEINLSVNTNLRATNNTKFCVTIYHSWWLRSACKLFLTPL